MFNYCLTQGLSLQEDTVGRVVDIMSHFSHPLLSGQLLIVTFLRSELSLVSVHTPRIQCSLIMDQWWRRMELSSVWSVANPHGSLLTIIAWGWEGLQQQPIQPEPVSPWPIVCWQRETASLTFHLWNLWNLQHNQLPIKITHHLLSLLSHSLWIGTCYACSIWCLPLSSSILYQPIISGRSKLNQPDWKTVLESVSNWIQYPLSDH